MRTFLAVVVLLICMGRIASPLLAAEPQGEDLADRVRVSIEQGVKFLRDTEAGRGHWGDMTPVGHTGGWTSLALLAMLNAGVPPEEAIIQRGLKSLRGVEPTWNYVVSLQTLVYAMAGQNEDRERIQRNVD